jgi:AcrR family transcriptional regulator
MRRGSAAHPAASTRERILEAAIRRFARQSYEQTGLRDIAADVGVDVAYVHRCFGSKEKLFAEAIRASVGPGRGIPNAATADLAGALARQALAREGRRSHRRIGPLDIAVRSLSSPKAASILRNYILDEFITPLGARLGEPAARRAALVAALLAGLGILKDVLEIEPLRETAGGGLEQLVASAITDMLGEPPMCGPPDAARRERTAS